MNTSMDSFLDQVGNLATNTRGQPGRIRQALAELVAKEVQARTTERVTVRSESLGSREFYLISSGSFRTIVLFKITRTYKSAQKNWKNRLNDFYREMGEAALRWKDAQSLAVWALPADWLTEPNLKKLQSAVRSRAQGGEHLTLAVLRIGEAPERGELETDRSFTLSQALANLLGQIGVSLTRLSHHPIHELEIRNLRCFECARISLMSSSGAPRMWTVIIGENNTGKSTLLQAIALASVSQTNASSMAMSISNGRLDNLVRQESYRSEITASSDQSTARVRISRTEVTNEPSSGLALRVLGYGPWRRLPTTTGLLRSSSSSSPSLDGLTSLFESGTPLTDPESWLKTQDYLRRSGEKNSLELVRMALIQLLPEIDSVDVHPKGVTVKTQRGHRIPLRLMSDGYKAMATLVVDIVARLAEDQEIETLEKIAATVLIDELDLHLHPRWQMNVIHDLRALFPSIQFIVTTHSPLILLGARKGEVLRLEWSGASVDCVATDDNPELLRVDQVLHGLFGLSSVRGPTAQERLTEMERLLQRKWDAGLTLDEEGRLDELQAYESSLPYFEDPSITIQWVREKLDRLG